MNHKRKLPFRNNFEKSCDLHIQKFDIELNYSNVTCSIGRFRLNANFEMQCEDYQNSYKFKVEYVPNSFPKVFILSPKIEPLPAYHLNYDNSICLFDPVDIGYRKRFSIAREIIPWTIKWTVYYEIFLINGGQWLGDETPHGIRNSNSY